MNEIAQNFYELLNSKNGVSSKFELLGESSKEQLCALLIEHGLAGSVYVNGRDILADDLLSRLKPTWQKQRQRNLLQYEELKNLSLALEASGIRPIILKGMALIGSVYTDLGERNMSDIDLLVGTENIDKMLEIVEEGGFLPVATGQWWGNSFKWEFQKSTAAGDVVLELHSNLFYGTNKNWWRTDQASSIRKAIELENFDVLKSEDQFVHLCGHLGYQHTFLKLNWLLDIKLSLEQQKEHFDWNRVSELASQLGMRNSCLASIYAVEQVFEYKTDIEIEGKKWSRGILSRGFLLEPHSNKIRYILLKHLLKDKISTAFQYDFLWACHRIGRTLGFQLKKSS
jgi:hypothetical protein